MNAIPPEISFVLFVPLSVPFFVSLFLPCVVCPLLTLPLPLPLRVVDVARYRQVAVTCFFRNSHSFGYAALVAAFTAVLMFVGSTTVLGADGEAVSLARIVNTVVGIFIYLTVDTLLGRSTFERLSSIDTF